MASSNTDDLHDLRNFFIKELECPVCFEVPETTPIYQCANQHIHCDKCHPKLDRCPICRITINLNDRSLLAEKIHEKVLVACKYKGECSVRKVNISELLEHEAMCEMLRSEVQCNYCKLNISIHNLNAHEDTCAFRSSVALSDNFNGAMRPRARELHPSSIQEVQDHQYDIIYEHEAESIVSTENSPTRGAQGAFLGANTMHDDHQAPIYANVMRPRARELHPLSIQASQEHQNDIQPRIRTGTMIDEHETGHQASMYANVSNISPSMGQLISRSNLYLEERMHMVSNRLTSYLNSIPHEGEGREISGATGGMSWNTVQCTHCNCYVPTRDLRAHESTCVRVPPHRQSVVMSREVVHPPQNFATPITNSRSRRSVSLSSTQAQPSIQDFDNSNGYDSQNSVTEEPYSYNGYNRTNQAPGFGNQQMSSRFGQMSIDDRSIKSSYGRGVEVEVTMNRKGEDKKHTITLYGKVITLNDILDELPRYAAEYDFHQVRNDANFGRAYHYSITPNEPLLVLENKIILKGFARQ